VRAGLRLLGFLFHILYTRLKLFIAKYFQGNTAKRMAEIRKSWAKEMCALLGFKITTEGELPEEGTYLYVSNHRSSLDPLVPLAFVESFPIAKAEVEHYFLVGRGAAISGVIFVKKKDKNSRGATKEAIYEALKSGKSIVIYPEGHTNVETLTDRFNKGSFEKAAQAGVPVVPLAIEYEDTRDNWDHSQGLLGHYFSRFGKRRTNIKMAFGQPLKSDDTFELLNKSQKWINDKILVLRKEWEEEVN
jgi:1-acyl-sn-glycerol-3-phosphate acyltransferase